MKKSIKIIIIMLILLTIILVTRSNAAVETKPGTTTTHYHKDAFLMSYDMRYPTSSLGNNTLDPHLELNKDYGAWVYLGMSAYGTNASNAVIVSRSYLSSTPNETGVIQRNGSTTHTAGIYDINNSNEIVQKYGNTKYLEVFDTYNENDFTVEKTKGMALAETKGWYGDPHGSGSETANIIVRAGRGGGWDTPGYGYKFSSSAIYYFRPVIWN